MINRPCNNMLPRTFLVLICIAIIAGCAGFESQGKAEADALAQHLQPLNGEAKIIQSWQGDYPLDQLDLLPENQRQQSVGFIGDAETFKAVWNTFKPGEVPDIDFKTNLVLFARNTQFYNRIRIGKVNVTNGVAEVLAMETMSAMPIEDKVAMSLVVIARQGITGIQSGDEIIQINKTK
jgi:predicted MPP superfamily phosphohydrolase